MNLASLFRQHRRWLGIGGLTLLLLLALSASVNAAQGDNGTCLGCHNNKDLSIKLASGEVLPLYVDPAVHNASVHGMKGQTCVSCHTNISGYPHPKVTGRRPAQLPDGTLHPVPDLPPGAVQGDAGQQPRARALAGGNRNAAICTDCHGSHNVSDANSPRQKVSQACQKCHSTISDQYAHSVHGRLWPIRAIPMCRSAPTATAYITRKTRRLPRFASNRPNCAPSVMPMRR